MIIQVIYLSTEIDLLEAELHELDGIIDKFIIVEYPFNYSGASCKMYYNENKERFKKFHDKIIHIIDDNDYNGMRGIYLQKIRQRSPILIDAISFCKDNDFVITCDGDAFIKKQAFDNIDLNKHTVFRMEWCQYWLNAYCPNVAFDWTFGAKASLYREVGSFEQVVQTITPDRQFIMESGWHWSKMGGVEKLIENIKGYPHQEYSKNPLLIDPILIQERIDNMWGWDDFSKGKNPASWKYEYRKFDFNYYPKYIGDNLDIYSKYIKWI